jgi:hypothetical protein
MQVYGVVETSRLLHFLDNRLTGADEVVSLTRRPRSPQEESRYSFLLEAQYFQEKHYLMCSLARSCGQ